MKKNRTCLHPSDFIYFIFSIYLYFPTNACNKSFFFSFSQVCTTLWITFKDPYVSLKRAWTFAADCVQRVVFCQGQAKEKKYTPRVVQSIFDSPSSERRGNQEEAADNYGWQNINDRRNCVVIPVICRSLLSRAPCDRDRSSFPCLLRGGGGGLIFLEFHERSNWNSVWKNSPSVTGVRERIFKRHCYIILECINVIEHRGGGIVSFIARVRSSLDDTRAILYFIFVRVRLFIHCH